MGDLVILALAVSPKFYDFTNSRETGIFIETVVRVTRLFYIILYYYIKRKFQ